jgi:hypothetical protein
MRSVLIKVECILGLNIVGFSLIVLSIFLRELKVK